MIYLKQSTASQEFLLGPFVDSTDGNTAETGLTIANTDIKIWVAGATTLASKNSGGATHISNGNYYCVLDATDTATVGSGAIVVQVAGALAVRHEFHIFEEEVYDDMFAASAVGYLKPTTAGRDLDVSAGGEAGLDWANIGSPTTAVNLSATNIDVDQVVASVSGAVASVTGNVGGNVTGSVGSVASGGIAEASFATTAGTFAPLGIIDQGTAQSATGTTLVLRAAAAFGNSDINGATIVITGGTTGVGQRRLITGYVGATDTATVDTWDTTPTGTITYKIFGTAPSSGGGAGLDAAGVRAAVGLASANLDTQLGAIDDFIDTEVSAIKAKTDQLTFTTSNQVDCQPISIAASAITATSIASNAITAAKIATDAITSAQLAASAVTEIQTGLSTLDAAAVRAAVGLASANLDTQISTIDDFLDTEISAIVTATGAAAIRAAVGLASANLDTQLSTIDDFLDTEVAAIKAKTDQLTFGVANQVNANVESINTVTVLGAGTSGDKWRA